MPWAGEAAHQDTCGAGCTPTGQNDDFIACLSPDVPRDDTNNPAPSVVTPLCHPVSGASYGFADPKAAGPFQYVCFGVCDEEGTIALAGTPESCLSANAAVD